MALFESSKIPETRGDELPLHDQASDHETNVNMSGCLDILLRTTRQVNDQLQVVQKLRRQSLGILGNSEQEWIDQTIAHAGVAILNTSCLVESSITQQVGKRSWVAELSFSQRMKRLNRDTSQIVAQISQLSITAQSLNTAMKIMVLCDRQVGGSTILVTSDDQPASKNPPSQELSELMNRRRRTYNGSSLDNVVQVQPTTISPASGASRPTSTPIGHGQKDIVSAQDSTDTPQDQQLVLVVDAVEKWRQTAEQALREAAQEFCEGDQRLSSLQPKLSVVCHASSPVMSKTAQTINTTDLPSREKDDGFLMSGGLAISSAGSRLVGPPSLAYSTPTSEYNQEGGSSVRRKPIPSQALADNRDFHASPSESSHTTHTPRTPYTPLNSHFENPKIIDVRQSFGKEAVGEQPQTEDIVQSAKKRRQSLGILPDAFLSSHPVNPPYHSSDNHSSISLSTLASQSQSQSQSQSYQISRGRAWLEWKAECLQ